MIATTPIPTVESIPSGREFDGGFAEAARTCATQFSVDFGPMAGASCIDMEEIDPRYDGRPVLDIILLIIHAVLCAPRMAFRDEAQ